MARAPSSPPGRQSGDPLVGGGPEGSAGAAVQEVGEEEEAWAVQPRAPQYGIKERLLLHLYRVSLYIYIYI